MRDRQPLLSRKLRIGLLRVAFVPILFCALFGWRSWEDESVADFAVEWSGYVFLMAGMGIRLWSTLYIGGRKSKQLVTDGPYSLCRNPLYVGTVLLSVGASLCLENILMLLVSLAVMISVHALVTSAEERHLEDLFGDDFQAYKRSVPRFVPSFRSYRSPEHLTVSSLAVRRIVIEASAILLIPVLGDLIEMLHAGGVLPVLCTFP